MDKKETAPKLPLPEGFKEENNIVYGVKDGLMHVKLNRPEKKNALYPDMYSTIRE